jgi:hypothetical protein
MREGGGVPLRAGEPLPVAEGGAVAVDGGEGEAPCGGRARGA